jgi:hypothetical protein
MRHRNNRHAQSAPEIYKCIGLNPLTNTSHLYLLLCSNPNHYTHIEERNGKRREKERRPCELGIWKELLCILSLRQKSVQENTAHFITAAMGWIFRFSSSL